MGNCCSHRKANCKGSYANVTSDETIKKSKYSRYS